jgi:hypothetical protein
MACPSSALGLNCCQFSCCIPSIPAIDFPINLHPDWMGNLVQSCPDICLRDMVIPGTHDSGSYSIDTFKPFSAVGRTQNVTVVEQLHRGARYLDLHIAGSGRDKVSIFHGCLQGTVLERVLEDIHLFCQDFPGEFLIVELSAEFGRDFKPAQKKKALDLVKDILGDKLYVENDCKKLRSTPLKDLTQSGKQICVLLQGKMYEELVVDGTEYTPESVAKEYGFFSSDVWMSSKYNYVVFMREDTFVLCDAAQDAKETCWLVFTALFLTNVFLPAFITPLLREQQHERYQPVVGMDLGRSQGPWKEGGKILDQSNCFDSRNEWTCRHGSSALWLVDVAACLFGQ